MKRSALVLGAVAAALASAVIGVAVWLVLRDSGPSPAVSIGGWSGQATLCPHPEESDELSEMAAGEVLALDDPEKTLGEARCRADGVGGKAPELRDDAAYFVLNTGRDRFHVALVGVDLAGRRPRLEAEVTVPGDRCGVTADYRGQLMLVIEAPEGSAVPAVSLREVPLQC